MYSVFKALFVEDVGMLSSDLSRTSLRIVHSHARDHLASFRQGALRSLILRGLEFPLCGYINLLKQGRYQRSLEA